ncbi:hypothetical protein [Alkalibacterium olivapovliticus]|uniref:Cystine transport system permease protein n=1 Tax=Alkalibacterium olivapovliticus TaxID=99907 RepID=A0A2T0WAC2_9LACT|nr:hypothetical protein [Alkalibacterium olivapovliticus]PRY83659.1 cystine transport system permease protein [Alkalibacterium olivapovliticus]
MEEVFIDFYREKDEQAFLEAWQAKYGSMSDDEIDTVYESIADAIDEAVKDGSHELGSPFVFKDITVGKSDFNTFYSLYIFEQEK